MSGSCLWTDSARGESSSSPPARQGGQKHSQGQRRRPADPCPQPRASFLVSSPQSAANTGVLTQTQGGREEGEGPRDWEEPITILNYRNGGGLPPCPPPSPIDGQSGCRGGKGQSRLFPAAESCQLWWQRDKHREQRNAQKERKSRYKTPPFCH